MVEACSSGSSGLYIFRISRMLWLMHTPRRRQRIHTANPAREEAENEENGGLVRKEGFEPPRPFGHKILSLARLPVPPLPHGGGNPLYRCGRPDGDSLGCASAPVPFRRTMHRLNWGVGCGGGCGTIDA